ncbi:MAG: DUF488 family protein [Planctomycetaceae bacterium]
MQAAKFQLWTIGHSNHPLNRFVELLTCADMAVLADIRRFPHSRSLPHFNGEALSERLGSSGIEYRWLEGLGGRRPKAASESPNLNTAWRNQSFRNYADYMLSDSFKTAFDELAEIAAAKRTAIMCSESVFWRCHRRLVSDFAVAQGASVMHIFPDGRMAPHTLTNEAVILEQDHRKVIYPGESDADKVPPGSVV